MGDVHKPDFQDIKVGPFTLAKSGLHIKGKPTFEEYQVAGDLIKRFHQASGWWLADWIVYGEGRKDWEARLDEAIDSGSLKQKTVNQYRYIAKKFPEATRVDGVSFSHHHAVVNQKPRDAQRLLKRAAEEGWSKHELAKVASAHTRTKVIQGQAVLEGMYRVIYADPPWLYNDRTPTMDGSLAKAQSSYAGMPMEEIIKLPVEAHALPDSILFMWVTAPFLYQNPGPREVIDAWGFTYKTNLVWDKVLGMPGHYGMQVKHEHLIIATRGKALPNEPLPHDDSVQAFRRVGEHSSKPEEIRAFITRHWTIGPYLELFARERHEGWTCFGNDARLWAEDARRTA